MNMGHGGLGRLFKEKPTLMARWGNGIPRDC